MIYIQGPNRLYSVSNVYIGNRAPTGSVIFAEDMLTNIVIEDNSIHSNIANMAAFYAGSLSNMYINNTKFINNTSVGPIVYITNSVNNLICSQSILVQNLVEVEGILSIFYAHLVILKSLKVEDNTATEGAMIKIKESINTTITMSNFQNNFCSNMPCSLSVQKTERLNIDQCFFINDRVHMNLISQKSSSIAVDIQANNIALKNVQFKGIPGYVYTGVWVENLLNRKSILCLPRQPYS